MKEAEKVVVRAEDLVNLAQFTTDQDTAFVLLIVRNDKFCLQTRTADDSVIWTTGWRRTITSDDCVYKLTVEDFLHILSLIFEDLDTDYVSFIFKDKKLTRVSTINDSVWFKYADKLN